MAAGFLHRDRVRNVLPVLPVPIRRDPLRAVPQKKWKVLRAQYLVTHRAVVFVERCRLHHASEFRGEDVTQCEQRPRLRPFPANPFRKYAEKRT